MTNVICVLSRETHGGSVYGAHDVNVLRAQVERYLKRPHRFICLTNEPEGIDERVEVRPLREGWPGWWAKVEVMRPGSFEGRNLFLDLDTVVVDDLDPLVDFKGTITDWHTGVFGSACITWDGDELRAIYDLFTPAVMSAVDSDGAQLFVGDQDWMHVVTRIPRYPDAWCQTHTRCVKGPTRDAKIVCFHGRNKPSSFPYPWVRDYWRL